MTTDNHLKYLIIEYYMKKKNGLGFSDMRRELQIKNYTPEDIDFIIKFIDDLLIYEEITQLKKIRNNEIKYTGYILIILGIILIIITLLGSINLGGSFILSIIPFAGGVLMLIFSKRMEFKYYDPPGYRFSAWRRKLNRFNRNI